MKQCQILTTVLLIFLLISGCGAISEEDEIPGGISEIMGADVREFTVIQYSDDHGGFHGDGTTIAIFALTQEQESKFLDEIEPSNYWHPFPLSENISRAIYGGYDNGVHYLPLFQDENNNPLVSRIETGYYFFYDRHSESSFPRDDTNLFSRNSWNFDLAVYDLTEHILYFLALDT